MREVGVPHGYDTIADVLSVAKLKSLTERLTMKCRVCGSEEFYKESVVEDLWTDYESVGGYDDYGNGSGTKAITEIKENKKHFLVCKECRIVYYFENDG